MPEESPGLEDRVGALPRPLLLAAAQERVALLGPGYGWNTSRFTPPSCTIGREPVSATIWSAVQLLLASWRSTGARSALPAALLAVEVRVVQRVEHPPPRPLEPVEEMPLRLVVEQHDVELVAEARGEGLDGGVAPHPRAPEILVVGQVEGDVVAPADQPVRELDHAPDAAEALEMRLDEAEAHDGLAGYRPADAASERPLTLSASQVGAREGRIMPKGDSMKESLLKRSPAVIFGTLALVLVVGGVAAFGIGYKVGENRAKPAKKAAINPKKKAAARRSRCARPARSCRPRPSC